jgi:hypothetical protein
VRSVATAYATAYAIEIVVQRVVAEAGGQPDFEVVIGAVRARENGAHLVTEIAFNPRGRARRSWGSGSCAHHRKSCSTYGYMHADVFPVATAPRIMTPV